MPAVSQAQFRAMQAAKSGHSTLGIPKSVGADFVAATPSAKGLPKRAPKGKPSGKKLGDEF
jgi:hypothetical protein